MIHPNSRANLRSAPAWKPGQSGNFKGGARGYRQVLAMARKASPEMMQALIDCVRSSNANWNEKIRAADIVLTRAWGAEGKIDLNLDADRVSGIVITIERGETATSPPAAPQLEHPQLTIDVTGSGDN